MMPPMHRRPPRSATSASAAPARRGALVFALVLAGAVGACRWWCGGVAELDGPLPLEALLAWQQSHPIAFGAGFLVLFSVLATLAIPGCGVLGLLAGAVWGWAGGALLVTLASTVGATLSFLGARHLLRDRARRRWGAELDGAERWLGRGGAWIVVGLRVVPLLPFPVLNPLLGLTAMSTLRFVVASAVGLWVGSAAYAWVGAEIAGASGLAELARPSVVAAAVALLAVPAIGVAFARPRLALPPRNRERVAHR